MAIPWGLVTLVIGFVYGAVKHGKQDKSQLFKQGFVIGIVLAIVLALIGYFTGYGAIGLTGALGIILSAIVLSLLFILGVWIGDLVTRGRDARSNTRDDVDQPFARNR